jgi:hypothetical protein
LKGEGKPVLMLRRPVVVLRRVVVSVEVMMVMLRRVVVSVEVLPARTVWLDLAFFVVVVNDCVIVMFCAYFE